MIFSVKQTIKGAKSTETETSKNKRKENFAEIEFPITKLSGKLAQLWIVMSRFIWCCHEINMVRFNKKESEARKELLTSMNQVNDAKENENGKDGDEGSSLTMQTGDDSNNYLCINLPFRFESLN